MGRVTQRVDPSALAELVAAPPRAAVAFVAAGRIEPLPAAFRHEAGRLWVGVDPDALPGAGVPERGVVVVDAGRWWFELRAVTWRGRLAAAAAPPPGGSRALRWLELVPDGAVAWDYATLHEEPDA